LKDAYQKPDVEEAHNAILKDVTDLQTAAEQRIQAESASSSRNDDRAPPADRRRQLRDSDFIFF